ncbi:hypothetical protein ACRXCV_04575 [Halobacteriovorax sp. GFR7]|uniref:hypothetical protein n=1 Tax=unclassified Halobacteriovorax TaxID=2639665 RepID=UPI003D972BEE
MKYETSTFRHNLNFFRFLMIFVGHIDRLRAIILKYAFRVKGLKSLYISRDKRIFSSYVVLSFFSMALSVLRPDMLLIFGPLIYGYWHLISSYKYSSCLNNSSNQSSNIQRYIIYGLIAITFLEMCLRFYVRYFNSDILLPNGFIGLTLSIIYFFILFICYGSFKQIKSFLACFLIGISILFLAWNEPLNFVSITLFGHNWIAFIFWFKFSRSKKNLKVAIYSFLIFILFHLFVLYGVFDSYYYLYEEHFFVKSGYQKFAWILAPWSDESINWMRGLSLYTFGLSMHYFIWLRAIPENIYKNKTPVSFKKTLISIHYGFGPLLSYLLIFISIIGTILWLAWFEIGTLVYFFISNIHVWTELSLLFLSFSIFRNTSADTA